MNSLPNLLIVDDSPENLVYYKNLLKKIEANQIQALSGREALEKANGIELALALIDVRMPGMNGYELAVKLNESRSGTNVPIIFITASHVSEMQIFEGYGSGAVDYIFKPVNSLVLVSKINVFLDLFNQKRTIINDAALLKKSADELIRVNSALRKSEEKYRSYIDNAPDGVFITDENNKLIEINHAASKITGYSKEELLEMSISDLLQEDSLEFGLARFELLAKTGAVKGDLMFRHKNGYKRWVTLQAVILTKNRFLCFTKDITERKMAEQAVMVSEEKYKTMLNASPDGILLIDLNGIVTEVSEIGLEIFGSDNREDILGKNFQHFIQPTDNETIKEIFAKTMNEGLAQNFELTLKKKNQSIFAGEVSTTLIQGLDGTPLSFMIIVRDISHRKKMEAKQIHSDRMANLGEMASGIAHEINQPLNTISLVMDNILYEAGKDRPIAQDYLKKKLDRIFENITRVRNIIDHVRAFSRNQDDFISTGFDINLSIRNAVSMITEQCNHLAIHLDLRLDDNMPVVIGNTFKFEQVILNLLSNAKDALLEKKSRQTEPYDMWIRIRSFQQNKRVIAEMTDNGVGITDQDIGNVMLPFYTTKDAGKGTGLGLSISYQIIKEMNGTIEIAKDSLGETIFRIIM